MDRRSATIVPTTKGTISSSSSFSVARRNGGKKGEKVWTISHEVE